MMQARQEAGQMTIEFAVVFPVLVIVAFIALQGIAFAGDCVAFDEVARDVIRRQADDGYEGADGAGEVAVSIEEALGLEHIEVEATCEKNLAGHVRYEVTMHYTPPLLKGVTVFGSGVPRLTHGVSLTISPYRKGVVI